ncbi:MAG: phosphoribosylamine--glycine ligase [Spirochaetia bacterium]|nr:phosphoribosylamine--glycine ligase [Spirochaetota bacterium]MCX8096453.1 phosphoribosylamine--glycine ligase [Spirochaetota bacterium]MDW8112743.1 phosphoribosylamine--glycine ligase [Spirochaetia bacterium]
MNVCVIGSGGREHALAWKLSKSLNTTKLFCVPGNGGTQSISENVSISLKYPFNELVSFIKERKVDLVVIGPEAPLVDGIVDILTSKGIKAFGPNSGASRLEGSKVFAKLLMKKNRVPTADFEVFEDFESAKVFFEKHPDWVIKFDGLAGGKGVVVPSSLEEGISFLEEIFLKDKFSSTSKKVVIEKKLEGYELSAFVITDGEDVKFLSTAQDHKRAFDGDRGPNTGGMGAYAPVPFVSKELVDKIMKKIVYPTIEGLAKEGITYKGVLYCGLMIDKNDEPYVLEFNCRFGDPEAQVILPIMKTDFYDVASATAEGLLKKVKFEMYEKFAGCVVLASNGYPGDYEKGMKISGDLSENDDVVVFHAGTTLANGNLITNGGRVLNVVGISDNLKQALNIAYARVEKIHFDGMFYRKDIGWRVLSE